MWMKAAAMSMLALICLLSVVADVVLGQDRKYVFPKYREETPVSGVTTSARKDKFFPIFTLIRFPNEVCNTAGGRNGTCYTSDECRELGGKTSGSCAAGFGVCCLFEVNCDTSIKQNCTYFLNPGAPGTYDDIDICKLTVDKEQNVCQLRLDFETFELAKPAGTDGKCDNDRFTVRGVSSVSPPAVCGTNSGQHMYVEYGSSERVTLNVVTGGPSFDRRWKIKVTFVECGSLAKAPSGCLQYFVESAGQVKIFNYDDASAGPHLADLSYTVCVRMEDGFCSVQWSTCDPTSFTLTDDASADPTTANRGDIDCTTDYVAIPGASGTSNGALPTFDRFCGTDLSTVDSDSMPAPVYSFSQPFLLRVMTDNSEPTGDKENRGFCLKWKQSSCSN